MDIFTYLENMTVQQSAFIIAVLMSIYYLWQLINEYYREVKIDDALLKNLGKKEEPFTRKLIRRFDFLSELAVKFDDKCYKCSLNYKFEQVLFRCLIVGTVGFALGIAINNPISAILLCFIGLYIPYQLVQDKIYKRSRLVNRQVMHMIQAFLNQYQKTNNITEVFSLIIPELDAPLDKECGLVIRQLDSGYTVREALSSLAERANNEWIYLFTNCLIMNDEDGTEVTDVLMETLLKIANKEVAEGDRDSEIYGGKVLTYVMMAAVPIAFVLVCFMQEGAFDLYFHTFAGQMVVNIAIFCVVIGFAISKIVEQM